jgi:hypothetical protein
VKVKAPELPPPGCGLNTVTALLLAEESEFAGMTAVTRVSLTNVVAKSVPFHSTVEPSIKLEPTTLTVMSEAPSALLFGEMAAMVGTGFRRGGLVVVVELLPPQFIKPLVLTRTTSSTAVLIRSSELSLPAD